MFFFSLGNGPPPLGMGGPPPQHWGHEGHVGHGGPRMPVEHWDRGNHDDSPPIENDVFKNPEMNEAEIDRRKVEKSETHSHPEVDIDLNGEVWVETKADGGKSYFYNARTRETTWTRPEEKDGVKVLSQDQVDKLTQKLAHSGKKDDGHPDQFPAGAMPGYNMPPPGYASGPPTFGAPHGYPPPWAMGGPSGFPPNSWPMPPGNFYHHQIP